MTTFLTPLSSSLSKAAYSGLASIMARLDRFVALPQVEPKIGDVFYRMARQTQPHHFLSSWPLRATERFLTFFGGHLDRNSIPLGSVETHEYLVRHIMLSAVIAPLVTAFLFRTKPDGIRLSPEEIRTLAHRYFDLLYRDAANAGRLYPREILDVAFGDLDGSQVMQATYGTRRRMMEAMGQGARFSKAPASYDLSRWPKYFYIRFHWRDSFDLQDAWSWDSQTELLFNGAYGPMQRAGLPATLAALEYVSKTKNGRSLQVAQIGAGTGTFANYLLKTVHYRRRHHDLQFHFIDMSPAHMNLARQRLSGWKDQVQFYDFQSTGACAEKLPFKDNSLDVIVVINLFHELPPHIRRKAVSEMNRVLTPGGRVIFADSLQRGEGADGLLEAFGNNGKNGGRVNGAFLEPYHQSYVLEDLEKLFGEKNLKRIGPTTYAYLAKMLVFEKIC